MGNALKPLFSGRIGDSCQSIFRLLTLIKSMNFVLSFGHFFLIPDGTEVGQGNNKRRLYV